MKFLKGLGVIGANIGPTSDVDIIFSKMYSQYVLFRNKYYSINVWPFSYWPCYMPEVLIMAEDGCNGPGQRRGPLQPSEAIINTKGM
jgi:hypothetical protein